MRRETTTLEVKLSVATGTAQLCDYMVNKWIQLSGTFSATIKIQGTIDGTNWLDITSLTAPAWFEIPQNLKYIRTDTTVYASGTPACVLAGLDARST